MKCGMGQGLPKLLIFGIQMQFGNSQSGVLIQDAILLFFAAEMTNSPEAGGGLKRIKCPSCGTIFQHLPKTAHGDPRNIAYCGKLR